jgi:pyridoxamine 5'-phosphate oxidase family protein
VLKESCAEVPRRSERPNAGRDRLPQQPTPAVGSRQSEPTGIRTSCRLVFVYNPELQTIDIGGHNFAKSKKFRDVLSYPWVALVVDDLASVTPWVVRGIEFRRRADVLEGGGSGVGPGFDEAMFRIRPTRIVAWGLEGGRNARSIKDPAS